MCLPYILFYSRHCWWSAASWAFLMVVSWPCLVAPFKSLHKNWTLELSDVNHRMCKTWIWESEDESFRSDRIRPVWAKGGWPGDRYFLSDQTLFVVFCPNSTLLIFPGCLLALFSLPMTVGPPIAGLIFDKVCGMKESKDGTVGGFWERQRHHIRMSQKGNKHISVDIIDVGTIIITTTSPKLLKR